MSTQISAQASKLWSIVSAPDTAGTYKQAVTLTWQILKETALLVWLVLCLVLVAFDWLGTVAIATGRNVKTWFNTLQHGESEQIASDTGKALLTVGKTGIASTIALAREQLGLPEKPSVVELTDPTVPPATVAAPNPIIQQTTSKSAPVESSPLVVDDGSEAE